MPLIYGHQNVHQTLGSVLLSTADEGRVCEEFLNPSGQMWQHVDLRDTRHLVDCKEASKGVAQDAGTRSLALEVLLEWCAVEEALRHGIQVASVAQIRKASERLLGNA